MFAKVVNNTARLLDNRGQSLSELPEGNFAFEVSRLGHAIAGLKNVTAANTARSNTFDCKLLDQKITNVI